MNVRHHQSDLSLDEIVETGLFRECAAQEQRLFGAYLVVRDLI